MTKGYLVVASNKISFYNFAINLIESVKDHDPETPFCLITEERFLDGREDIADDLIFCDSHYRAKLWAMTQTPYDVTMYIDADVECEHEDIKTCFDQLNDNHILFTALTEDRSYTYSEWLFDTPEGKTHFDICGGVCLYDMRIPIVKEFINEWWELYRKQHTGEWWPDGYKRSLSDWDQFTVWWMLNRTDKYKDLKLEIFEDDLRWNYYNAWNWAITKSKDPVILRHYSCGVKKD